MKIFNVITPIITLLIGFFGNIFVDKLNYNRDLGKREKELELKRVQLRKETQLSTYLEMQEVLLDVHFAVVGMCNFIADGLRQKKVNINYPPALQEAFDRPMKRFVVLTFRILDAELREDLTQYFNFAVGFRHLRKITKQETSAEGELYEKQADELPTRIEAEIGKIQTSLGKKLFKELTFEESDK